MQPGSGAIPYFLVVFFLLQVLIVWLAYRILAQWQPFYAKRRVKYAYWGMSIAAGAVIYATRLVRPEGILYKVLVYIGYIWITGLVAMLLFLLLLKAGRAIARRLISEPTPADAEGAAEAPSSAITRRQFLQGAAIAAPAVPFALSAMAVIGGNNTIKSHSHNLAFPNLPTGLDGFKIAQISDTHIGPFFSMAKLDRVLAMVEAQKPDVMVITGDLIDDLELLVPTMERLSNFSKRLPHGIYYCWGNHEYFRNINRIREGIKASTVKLLENANKELIAGSRPLYFAGVDYPWARNGEDQKQKRKALLSKALTDIPPEAFTVLLSHHPDFFDESFAAKVPLTLAGHTHGGQVAVFGQTLLPVRYKYMRGLYEQNNAYGYVSVGTGHWLPFRLGTPAEVSFFSLASRPLS